MHKLPLQVIIPYLRFLPPAANLLLVMLIATSLAQLTWLFVPQPEQNYEPLPAAGGSQIQQRLNMDLIAGSEIFGPRSATGAPGKQAADAPETSLNLTLKGIFASLEPESSRALIADASGKERPYAVGDDIPGGAILREIKDDRVILERSGRYETLRLERGPRREGAAVATVRAPVSAGTPAPGQATTLAEMKTEILRDPGKAAQYVRLQPVYAEGKLQGYRIYPGPNRQLFQQTGLRAGELVTSVNGVQLDDAAKALQLLSDVKDLQELTLTLERAGQTRTLNLSLNQ
jgi:general secretion pathway protein C